MEVEEGENSITAAVTPQPSVEEPALEGVFTFVDGSRYEGEYVVVDCGEGTQQQLLKASAKSYGANRFRPSRTNVILVTHLHGDHSFGLPGLIVYLDNAATEKAPPLQIVGPVGVAAFLRTALILSRTELKRGYRVTELATPAPTGGGAYEGAALCTTCLLYTSPSPRD